MVEPVNSFLVMHIVHFEMRQFESVFKVQLVERVVAVAEEVRYEAFSHSQCVGEHVNFPVFGVFGFGFSDFATS